MDSEKNKGWSNCVNAQADCTLVVRIYEIRIFHDAAEIFVSHKNRVCSSICVGVNFIHIWSLQYCHCE